MDPTTAALYASLAVNAVGIVGGLVLAAKLATARQDADDAAEIAYIWKKNCQSACEKVGLLEIELAGHRAKAEKVRLSAKRASDASAAKRKAKA